MNESHPNPDIVLFVGEKMPDILIDDLIFPLKEKSINIRVVKQPYGVAFNAFEWIIPTAIVTFLFKSFFDSFLKEAGKDAYSTSKTWLKSVATTSRLIKVNLITSSQSTDKINKEYTQSLSYSAIFQTKDGRLIKVLFDDRLDNLSWEIAIEKMFANIADHYTNYPNDQLSLDINALDIKGNNMAYALLDTVTYDWVYMSDQSLLSLTKG